MPNGNGCVTKLSGNRRRPYVFKVTVGFDENGKQIMKPVSYHETREEGLDALLEYNKNPYDIDAKKLTFKEAFELWFAKKSENRKLSASVLEDYKSAFNKFVNLHKKIFINLKHVDLQDEIDNCQFGYTIKSHMRTLIRQMYSFAIKREWVKTDLSEGLEINVEKPETTGKAITKDHLKILWDNVTEDDEFALIMIYTGMRPGEFVSINSSDVFLDENYMIGGIKTENGKQRIIPIHSAIKQFIERLYNPDNPFLLMSTKYKNKHMSKRALATRLEKAFNKIPNHEYIPYDCRHTCASLLHSAGVDDYSIAKIMGHSQKGITKKVYIHKETEELVQAINLIDVHFINH